MQIETIIEEHIHHFLQNVHKEYDGDKEALVIIRTYIKDGKITEENEIILKTQLMDSLKILGVGIPFVLIPGASVLMPIIIKIAEKHNINLLPSAFSDDMNTSNKKNDTL